MEPAAQANKVTLSEDAARIALKGAMRFIRMCRDNPELERRAQEVLAEYRAARAGA